MFCLFCLIRVVNEPLESISTDLSFSGNTLAEGTLKLDLSFCTHNLFIFLIIKMFDSHVFFSASCINLHV